MNKKVLVITLALVLVFATSAMAAVEFSGEFTFEANKDSFKLFKDGYQLTPSLDFNIKASNSDVEEETYETVDVWVEDELVFNDEGTLIRQTGYKSLETSEVANSEWINWEFEADISLENEKWDFGEYKLSLNDQLFSAHVWGRGFEHEDKATHFDMIKSDKKVEDDIRLRLEIPVSVADLTLDFDPADNMRAYLNAELGDVNVGLAYARLDWTNEADVKNIIVGQADTEVDAGGVDLGLEGAFGASLGGDDTGLAIGAGVDAGLTEQINADVSVKFANDKWDGDGPVAGETKIEAGTSYTEALYKAALSGDYTMYADEDKDATNSVSLEVWYRMSETLGYDDLFETDDDKWTTNDAPAFGAGVTIDNFETDSLKIYANASSPVVDDVAWVMLNAEASNKMKDYSAKVLGYILATDKLTVMPKAELTAEENEETSIDLEVSADYLIGYSETALNLTVGKEFQKDAGDNGRISASITVPF